MSKEHFWSTWSKPMFPATKSDAYFEERSTITRKTVLVRHEKRLRPGLVITKKIRVVCEDCNNGWMNNIEILARPILEPLIQGTRSIVLTQNQQKILAQWLTMKIMVAEHNVPEDAVIPRDARECFKADRTIPNYISIWIGRHDVPGWRTTFYRHTATMSLLPKPPPAALAGRKNVETMAFGFGALFVYAMISDPDGGVDLNNVITVSHLPRLWPSTGYNALWGAIVLRGNAPASIASTLDRVMARPRSLWMPGPKIQ
jgi:hypothetical protein